MYKTILQKKMLFVWMMFTVNAPAIESLKTTYVWKVDDIYKKIPVLYNIYKFMQRCNWYEKLHMKFVPCPEQFISQKVQAIMTMQCTAMKWNPLFACSKVTQLHQKLYLKWPHSYEAKILYMVLNVNFHLHKAKYIPFTIISITKQTIISVTTVRSQLMLYQQANSVLLLHTTVTEDLNQNLHVHQLYTINNVYQELTLQQLQWMFWTNLLK